MPVRSLERERERVRVGDCVARRKSRWPAGRCEQQALRQLAQTGHANGSRRRLAQAERRTESCTQMSAGVSRDARLRPAEATGRCWSAWRNPSEIAPEHPAPMLLLRVPAHAPPCRRSSVPALTPSLRTPCQRPVQSPGPSSPVHATALDSDTRGRSSSSSAAPSRSHAPGESLDPTPRVNASKSREIPRSGRSGSRRRSMSRFSSSGGHSVCDCWLTARQGAS